MVPGSALPPAPRPGPRSSLQHLGPGSGALVMGLCGLSLAWHRAAGLMGGAADAVAGLIGAVAAAVLLALAAALLWRARHFPQAWAGDLRHPVRHTLVATLSAGAILLATVAVALGLATGPGRPWVLLLWRAAALGHAGLTWWVLARWWRGAGAGQGAGPGAGVGAAGWSSITPLLFVPIVGNVLVPLAGVPLGQAMWSAAQFGVGLFFWPLVQLLLMARLLLSGPWPDRLLPANLILVAPPAVIGLSALSLGAPEVLAQALWGIALAMAAWVLPGLRRLAGQPFSLTHWGLSFPLAALAALTLRLAQPPAAAAGLTPAASALPTAASPGPMGLLGLLLLAVATLVVLALGLATLRGLRNGSLLVPEPVATLQPASL